MSDLSPDAVAHLWPVVQIIGAILGGLVVFVGIMWRGFKWLKTQIEETAKAMLAPMAKDLAGVERSTKKAHRRISRLRADLNLPPDHMDTYEEPEA